MSRWRVTENDVLLWPLRILKCAGMCAHITHTQRFFFLILWILKTGNLPRDSTTQSGLNPPTSFSKKMLHRHAHCMMAAVLQLRFPLLWCHLGSLCLGWSYPPLTHHCVDFSLVLKGILTRHIPPQPGTFSFSKHKIFGEIPFSWVPSFH